jgi:hypothetical protein
MAREITKIEALEKIKEDDIIFRLACEKFDFNIKNTEIEYV